MGLLHLTYFNVEAFILNCRVYASWAALSTAPHSDPTGSFLQSPMHVGFSASHAPNIPLHWFPINASDSRLVLCVWPVQSARAEINVLFLLFQNDIGFHWRKMKSIYENVLFMKWHPTTHEWIFSFCRSCIKLLYSLYTKCLVLISVLTKIKRWGNPAPNTFIKPQWTKNISTTEAKTCC